MKLNHHFEDVASSYLFTDIAHKVAAYSKAHPDASIIKMGIGDVTLPLAPSVVNAMKQASEDMGRRETFHGYGDEQGYGFLREAIAAYYAEKGMTLPADAVFVSDGAKSDLGNILDLFDRDNLVAVPDPVYPVYVDTNTMAGRKIRYLNATAENDFLPLPDGQPADIVYLCSPNNPTGSVYTRDQLQQWVDFALKNEAVLLFDSAYEAFVTDPDLPTSIYQIPGAEKCAIEFCSLSKTAGFTGTRCGYTVVPKELELDGMNLNKMWLRRQTTKFNGVGYIVQRGAEAVFSKEGRAQIKENLAYYQRNAALIAKTMTELGISYWGGKHSPYIWLKCPNGQSSWEFFDMLLNKVQIVGTPGSGFGKNGEGFFRLTAFNTYENTCMAMERLRTL